MENGHTFLIKTTREKYASIKTTEERKVESLQNSLHLSATTKGNITGQVWQ